VPFALLQAVAELPDEALRRGLDHLVERLDRADDPGVQRATTLLQQPAVRDLVRERVLEGVLEIRIEPGLVEKLHGEAAAYEAEAIRLAEATQHAFTVGLAYSAAARLHPLKGDWAKARSLIEHLIAVLRTGNVVLHLPLDEAGRPAGRTVESSRSQPGFLGWALHLLGDIAKVSGSGNRARQSAGAAVSGSWMDRLNTSDARGPSHGEAICREHDDRADDRHDEPDGIAVPVQADQTAHEPTDENAHDSKDGRDDKATRIATRHEELGDDADDQTEQDPSDNVHGFLLRRPWRRRRRQGARDRSPPNGAQSIPG
jgi:hypothetical protein